MRLKRFEEEYRTTPLLLPPELLRAIEEIHDHPLKQSAIDTLNRQLRSGIDDQALVNLVLQLREADRLCIVPIDDDDSPPEPRIICSLGLWEGHS